MARIFGGTVGERKPSAGYTSVVAKIVNQFGRRGGRGMRPWLLLPKVLAVIAYMGVLASILVMWAASGWASLEKADPRRIWLIEQTATLVRWVLVPSLLAAIALGAGLFLQHPGPFLRMRWVRVKLITLAVLIPAAHLYLSSRLGLLREAYHAGIANDSAAGQFTVGMAVALAGSAAVVILGRLKPRLGQNWARTATTMPTSAASAAAWPTNPSARRCG